MAKYEVKDGVGIIPEGTTFIEKTAFGSLYGEPDDNIIRITIPNTVTKIDASAFYRCINLEYVFIPDSVTEICDVAFYGCKKLKEIIIPKSVTKIGDGAFANCSELTSITIPDSVTEIGNHAFAGCSNVKKIVVSGNNKAYDSRNNCNAIIETAKNRMIAACETTIIPDSVRIIGTSAFDSFTGLTSINIPDSVEKIEFGAFCGCTGLTYISIPDSVTEIGGFPTHTTRQTNIWKGGPMREGCFSGCTGLTSINIPDSVKFIGDESFKGCKSLIRITTPVKSVKKTKGLLVKRLRSLVVGLPDK